MLTRRVRRGTHLVYDLAGLVLDRESPLVVGHPGRQLEHPVLAAVLVPDGRHANLGLALRHHVRVPDVFVVVDARVHHGRLGAALHARGVQGELGGVVLVVHDGEGDEEDDGDDDRGGDRDGDVDPDAPFLARGELVLLLAAGDARDRVALLRVDVAGRAETRAAPLAEQPLGLVTRHDARSGHLPRAPVTSVPAEVDETSEKNEWRFALRGRWRCSTGDPRDRRVRARSDTSMGSLDRRRVERVPCVNPRLGSPCVRCAAPDGAEGVDEMTEVLLDFVTSHLIQHPVQ